MERNYLGFAVFLVSNLTLPWYPPLPIPSSYTPRILSLRPRANLQLFQLNLSIWVLLSSLSCPKGVLGLSCLKSLKIEYAFGLPKIKLFYDEKDIQKPYWKATLYLFTLRLPSTSHLILIVRSKFHTKFDLNPIQPHLFIPFYSDSTWEELNLNPLNCMARCLPACLWVET